MRAGGEGRRRAEEGSHVRLVEERHRPLCEQGTARAGPLPHARCFAGQFTIGVACATDRVCLTTSDGERSSTADGTLRAPEDYVPFSRKIVFDDDRDVTLVVPLTGSRDSGSLSVVLSSPTGAVIGEEWQPRSCTAGTGRRGTERQRH